MVNPLMPVCLTLTVMPLVRVSNVRTVLPMTLCCSSAVLGMVPLCDPCIGVLVGHQLNKLEIRNAYCIRKKEKENAWPKTTLICRKTINKT
jgi:hypothetical protein